MSMKRVELAMTLCEHRMGLPCTSKVKQEDPGMFIGGLGLAAMARTKCSGIFSIIRRFNNIEDSLEFANNILAHFYNIYQYAWAAPSSKLLQRT